MNDNVPTMGEQAETDLKVVWIGELQAEAAALDERGNALSSFTRTPMFRALPPKDQYLLTQQLAAMSTYFNILNERIFRAVNPALAAEADKREADEQAFKSAMTAGDTDDITERSPLQ